MDSKFYISLEVARLLKEKGYDEICDTAYDNEGIISRPPTKCNNTKLAALSFVFGDDCYSAPTKAEVIDWLESKGIVVETFYTSDNWFFSIIYSDDKQRIFSDEDYLTRLEAEDAAIIKALELLK